MSRYSTRGELDDPMIPNGDGGFVKFETRRHPTLLEAGVCRFAQNFRMENLTAKVRAGIDRITSDVQTAVTAFTLPSGLGTEKSVASITRVGTTATLTLTSTPLVDYTTGDEIEVLGADQSEYNSYSQTSGTVISGVRYRINTFASGDDFANIGGTNITGNVFTASGTTPTTWTNSSILQRLIDITKVSSTVYTYTVDSGATTPATGTITASPNLGEDSDGVYAACLFSDVDTDTEYIALARRDQVTLYNPNDTSTPIQVYYSDPSNITEQVEEQDNAHMLQVGNGLVINRGKKKKALEWNGNVFNASANTITAVSTGTTATATTAEPHRYVTGDIVTIAGADQSAYNGNFNITVTTETDFTYIMGSDPVDTATGTITALRVPQFIPIADTPFEGFLSMPKAEFSEYHPFARLVVPVRSIEYKVKNVSRGGSIVTAQTRINHGLQVGDRVNMSGITGIEYNGTQIITDVPSATSFNYVITGAPITPAGGSNKLATIDVRDQFIFSDIYDHKTYDPVTNLFRINRGGDDPLVGLKTWQNDNLIALYEKSIHVITGVSLPDLNLSTVTLITDEVGCVARNTVQIIGESIVFLSANGVYRLKITPELNLKGQDVPLSRDIQDQFTKDALAWGSIKNATSAYFNNRYYLAVPSNGQTRNDIVYVYNFINGGWESKDTFPTTANYIDHWVVCKKDGKDRLFGVSVEGAIQLWEELDHDELGSSPTATEIVGQIITRRYTGANVTNLTHANPFAGLENNRWIRGTMNITSLNGDVVTVTANTQDPDETVQSASYTFASAEDHMKRFRIGKRGSGCEIQIDSTTGRPEIRSVSVEGTEFQRANKNIS